MQIQTFQPVKQPLYEKVAHIIRRDIFLGKWNFGEHLNELKIAQDLRMSRGPVRDALKLLDSESIVETQSNGRTIVIGFTHKSFEDWGKIRLILEKTAILESVPNPDSINEIDVILQEIEQANQFPKDIQKHIFLDLIIHKSIIRSSGNRTLQKIWNTLSGTMFTLLELIAENYDNHKQNEMHINILKLIREGDAKSACSELEEHVNAGNKVIQKIIKFQTTRDSEIN